MIRFQLLTATVCFLLLAGCSPDQQTPQSLFESQPEFLYEVRLEPVGAESQWVVNEKQSVDDPSSLVPYQVQIDRDSLFVLFNQGSDDIYVYSTGGEFARVLHLDANPRVSPTSFFVLDSEIVIADHSNQVVALFDRQGNYINSFGMLPDHQTKLSPFAVTEYGGVIYAADISLRKVLAISNTDAEGITEKGELILGFPNDTSHALKFPVSLMVTFDGRMLVGDAGRGGVEVFTCDGRHVYSFDTIQLKNTMAPYGFDVDNIADPSLNDSTRFDPSNIHGIGRIHVVDANNAQVHMFSPLGHYIGSYPDDNRLVKPTGIAIDTKTNLVYIADPGARRIFVYKYRR